MILMILSVLIGLSAIAQPIEYRERNIDWGEVEVMEVSRSQSVSSGTGFRTLSVQPTIETRTLRLKDGHWLRIREQLETNAQGEEDRIYLDGEKLDELRIVATEDAVEAVKRRLKEEGCPIIARYGRMGRIFRARLPEMDEAGRERIFASLKACGASGDVRPRLSPMKFHRAYARTITPAKSPNDPFFSEEWHLGHIGATNVWADGIFGYPNIPCAVFDTGVHLTHEDLQENVLTRVSALRSSPDPEDHHGHGSHCLGIMGADANNGLGVTGVGQIANLTSIRGPISYGTVDDDILDGFQYALEHNIKVLSCSFGSPAGEIYYDEAEYEILEDLRRNGCLVVIAAGNDGNDNDRVPDYPAAYPNENIIAVIASNRSDHPVNTAEDGWSTSYGATSCDIAAPGVDIVSCTKDSDDAYAAWAGTSMATPIVAASAAMLWEQNPSWTWADVRNRLLATAAPNTALAGRCLTGARLDLKAAMSRKYAFSVTKLPSLAYATGTPMSIELTVSGGATEVEATLIKRDDENFTKSLGVFEVTEGVQFIDVWTPQAEDVGRGYLIKISGQGEAAEALAYSTVFRVKDAEVAETIAVTRPTVNAELDAADIEIEFTASAATYAVLEIESQVEDGTWTPETTLGTVTCTPGKSKSTTVELRGLGWISERPYRITVTDEDDPSVSGTSAPFYLTASSLSVTLTAEGLVRGVTNDWEIGVERRITCRLPQTDLYWLLLVDAESGETMILRETWTDPSDGKYREYRQFGLTIPSEVGGGVFYLKLVDAFDTELQCDSPCFVLTTRADGREEPSLAEALGDVTAHEFTANGQWYPEYADGGWRLRCGFVGAGESAYFETDVTGPVTVRYDFSAEDFPGELRLQRAKAPILKSTTWEDVDELVPAGDWRLRWTYVRSDKSESVTSGSPGAIDNLQFLVTMPTVKISTAGGILRITGAKYPTNIVYTLDGSMPTASSPLWVSGMNSDPYRFTLDRSMRIRARAYLEGTVPGEEAECDYFHIRGAGTNEDPIRIETPFDLIGLAESVLAGETYQGKCIRLMNDLDMSGTTMKAIGWEGLSGDDNLGYEVLSRIFNGEFDGNGHIIANPTFMVTSLSDYDAMYGLFGCAGENAYIHDITLASANGPILYYNEKGPTVENCKTMDEVPSSFDAPEAETIDYRDYGLPMAISPQLYCNAMPIMYSEVFLTNPLEDMLYNRTQSGGDWTVRYTVDGSDPTEEDEVLPESWVIPGRCTLRARVFSPPYYKPGPVMTVVFDCDWNENTKASSTLTLCNASVVNGAENYTETFEIRASAAPLGQRFSHWKVTGPLVLDDYMANPVTFKLMTKSPITLEAVYQSLHPMKLIVR